LDILTMHGPINVKSPNNISKWQMGFNSAFKGLKAFFHTKDVEPSISDSKGPHEPIQYFQLNQPTKCRKFSNLLLVI
jgi:hypothetical protein